MAWGNHTQTRRHFPGQLDDNDLGLGVGGEQPSAAVGDWRPAFVTVNGVPVRATGSLQVRYGRQQNRRAVFSGAPSGGVIGTRGVNAHEEAMSLAYTALNYQWQQRQQQLEMPKILVVVELRDKDPPPERECIVCLEKDAVIICDPCRHTLFCEECLRNMIGFNGGALAKTCPVCKAKIKGFFKLKPKPPEPEPLSKNPSVDNVCWTCLTNADDCHCADFTEPPERSSSASSSIQASDGVPEARSPGPALDAQASGERDTATSGQGSASAAVARPDESDESDGDEPSVGRCHCIHCGGCFPQPCWHCDGGNGLCECDELVESDSTSGFSRAIESAFMD